MKVSGFTFIRNAIRYDYPIVEAITSILPVCNEFVVAVGKSEDDTLGLIRSINSDKIKIVETVWDADLRESGKVLALETNKAFAAISPEADWAFYIQGDEVVHEKYLYTYQVLITKVGEEQAIEIANFYKTNFLVKYPKTMCVVEGNLLKTYKEVDA